MGIGENTRKKKIYSLYTHDHICTKLSSIGHAHFGIKYNILSMLDWRIYRPSSIIQKSSSQLINIACVWPVFSYCGLNITTMESCIFTHTCIHKHTFMRTHCCMHALTFRWVGESNNAFSVHVQVYCGTNVISGKCAFVFTAILTTHMILYVCAWLLTCACSSWKYIDVNIDVCVLSVTCFLQANPVASEWVWSLCRAHDQPSCSDPPTHWSHYPEPTATDTCIYTHTHAHLVTLHHAPCILL